MEIAYLGSTGLPDERFYWAPSRVGNLISQLPATKHASMDCHTDQLWGSGNHAGAENMELSTL